MEQDRGLGTNFRIQMGFLKDRSLGRVPQAKAGEAAMWLTAECWVCSLGSRTLLFSREAGDSQ